MIAYEYDEWRIPSETEFVQGAQSLLNYLINQGCDPSIIHGASQNPL